MKIFLILALLLLCGTWCSAAPAAREENGNTVLDNGRCRIVLDRQARFVRGENGPLAGSWFDVTLEDRKGLLPWEYWQEGSVSSFAGDSSAEVKLSQDKNAAVAEYVFRPGGMELTARVRLDKDAEGGRYSVTAKALDGTALTDIIDFTLSDMTVPEGWFLFPETLGMRIRPGVFEPGDRKTAPYPGFMYMQWLDLFNEDMGVYMGCEDGYGYTKKMYVGRGDEGRELMGFSFTGCWVAEKGDSWTTPDIYIVCHKGDWRKGADLYRPFAREAFGDLQTPTHILEMPASNCWLQHHLSNADVWKLFEVHASAPIHASYLSKTVNTSIPEGWDGIFGSSLELSETFENIKRLGGYSALFTFDRAPLMGKPNFADYAQKWANVKRSGVWEEAFIDMMPSAFDKDFRKQRVDEAVRWVKDFGLDEIHYDTEGTSGDSPTVGTGMAGGPCYRNDIGARPNETPHYFKLLYKETVEACKKINPDFTIRAEHCADFFYPEFGHSTAHFYYSCNDEAERAGWKPGRDYYLMPEVFRYTLPEFAQVQMPSVSNSEYWMYAYGMGHGFHGGGSNCTFDVKIRDAEEGSLGGRYNYYNADWFRYYDWRVGFWEATLECERMDTDVYADLGRGWQYAGLECDVNAVSHTGKNRQVVLGELRPYEMSSSHYVNYVKEFGTDMTLRPFRIKFPVRISDAAYYLYTPSGSREIKPSFENGEAVVLIEGTRLFAIEAVAGPSVRLIMPRKAALTGSEAEITVAYANAKAGSLSVTLPEGWEKPGRISVPAGTGEKKFRVRVPEGLFGRNYPVKAVYTGGGQKLTCAGHLAVAEPWSVGYYFTDAEGRDVLTQGKRAYLKVVVVNNQPDSHKAEVFVTGGAGDFDDSAELEGVPLDVLTAEKSELKEWLNEARPGFEPGCAMAFEWSFEVKGPLAEPVHISVKSDGKEILAEDCFPRVQVMDLNGEWKFFPQPRHRANHAGVEGCDGLDLYYATEDCFDGNWETIETPYNPDPRPDAYWTYYRKMVYIPAEWQGADLWLKVASLGTPWHQGTLNL
ncbi:MAG: hypothetical protein J5758_06340, partial [Abditibacteriota bacterium]|nr:hypothetical protein [Abditibacteriota bacterium]